MLKEATYILATQEVKKYGKVYIVQGDSNKLGLLLGI